MITEHRRAQKRKSDRKQYPDRAKDKLEYAKKRRSENPELIKERDRRYRAKYAPMLKARKAVEYAVKMGRLVRETCHCGAVGQAHHEDYSKPLDVVWLCKKHHAEIHRK